MADSDDGGDSGDDSGGGWTDMADTSYGGDWVSMPEWEDDEKIDHINKPYIIYQKIVLNILISN